MGREKIIVNYHIQGDPLSEENLDKTLNSLHKIRLLMPNKTIWLYSGYCFEDCIMKQGEIVHSHNGQRFKRSLIVEQCDVMVDGRYIDSQRNLSSKWRGSDNQHVINVQESLKQNKIILHCD